jgi:serine/threonine-protein kinase
MAFVYRAYDLALERTVAIKILRPEYDAGDTFRHEARAIAKLPHSNIVTVYDVGQDGDTQYIVMEYVGGQDLKKWIRADAPLRVGRAIDIVTQVCTAVAFAHEKGILHCDLKPQNVLVMPDGQVKVADFGIARVLSSTTTAPQSKVWGTPHYTAPELIAGKTLTPATDQYAIGVMLYEMLAGRPPFEGGTAVEIARQHALNAPTPVRNYNPRVPRYLEQILDRTLAKDPARRYPTAKQLGRLLQAYRQRGETATQPLTPIVPASTSAPQQGATARPRPPVVGSTPAVSTMPASAPLRPQPRKGIDWALLILGALAFVAVIGLVPLWGTIISQALGSQVPTPAPTTLPQSPPLATESPRATTIPPPTSTETTYSTIPDLVGQALDQAQQLASDNGLFVAVSEQRHDLEIPEMQIIAQDKPPGTQVPEGTGIAVIVSLGPERVTMPNTVGFPIAVSQLDLEDMGFTVTVTETWSTDPAGLIITQAPPAGTEITVGSTVTLTVSSGSRAAVQANLDNKVLLYSCELNGETFRPGDTVQILITWHVLDRLPEAYTTFIHITDESGRIVVQLDRPPLGGGRPTDTWRAGEKLLDPYTLVLPRDIAPGSYRVRVGLYRGNHRLPVIDPGLAEAEDDAVYVRRIQSSR